jgi:Trypsin
VKPASEPAVVRLQSCSATLITSTRLLTAAHCARELVPHETHVRVGKSIYTVQRVGRDPRYDFRQRRYTDQTPYAPPYDVAIAEVDRPVRDVQPLPLVTAPLRAGRSATITGFGIATVGASGFGTLRRAGTQVRSDSACRNAVRRADAAQAKLYVSSAMLCVQDPDNRAPYRAACNGDSGSPLLVAQGGRPAVGGVDSWGVRCGTRHNDPTVYVAVPAVLDFITAAAPPWEPEPAAPPTIAGTATPGATLTCQPAAWVGAPPVAQRYDWETPNSGAQGQTYVLKAQDAGGTIRCRVEADIAGGGAVYFTSAPITVAH